MVYPATVCLTNIQSLTTNNLPFMSHFILYGTLGCHLCELAEAQLSAAMAQLRQAVDIECIDIADSDELLERYGTRIPVLRRARDQAELDWPFADNELLHFLCI